MAQNCTMWHMALYGTGWLNRPAPAARTVSATIGAGFFGEKSAEPGRS
jgi:hypothetical protein